MKETSQAIAAVRREVQLSEWQRQVQERQEQGRPVDAWCASLGIKQGHVLSSSAERFGHICVNRMGVMEGSDPRETAQSTVVVPIRAAHSQEKKPLLKCSSESYRSDSTKAPTRSS